MGMGSLHSFHRISAEVVEAFTRVRADVAVFGGLGGMGLNTHMFDLMVATHIDIFRGSSLPHLQHRLTEEDHFLLHLFDNQILQLEPPLILRPSTRTKGRRDGRPTDFSCPELHLPDRVGLVSSCAGSRLVNDVRYQIVGRRPS